MEALGTYAASEVCVEFDLREALCEGGIKDFNYFARHHQFFYDPSIHHGRVYKMDGIGTNGG